MSNKDAAAVTIKIFEIDHESVEYFGSNDEK